MELGDLLRARIAADGPLTVAEFMELALYHPELGYYSGPERTTRPGHFVTSPELDPAFGWLWARAVEQVYDACGRPAGFALIEVGPGEGGLAAALLDALDPQLAARLSCYLVERSAAAEQRQRARLGWRPHLAWVSSLAELPPVAAGLVLANEVLDNQPVHLIEGSVQGPAELYVGLDDDGLTLVPGPLSPPAAAALARTSLVPAPGQRVEVSPAAEALAAACIAAIRRGAAVFIDYGDDEQGLMARPGGTLLAYDRSGAHADFLRSPGRADVTAHVNLSALARTLRACGAQVAGPLRQAEVLRALGAAQLHDELRRAVHDAAGAGQGVRAVRLQSRRAALGTLTDPAGLGGLQVLAGLKGVAVPPFLAAKAARGRPLKTAPH